MYINGFYYKTGIDLIKEREFLPTSISMNNVLSILSDIDKNYERIIPVNIKSKIINYAMNKCFNLNNLQRLPVLSDILTLFESFRQGEELPKWKYMNIPDDLHSELSKCLDEFRLGNY